MKKTACGYINPSGTVGAEVNVNLRSTTDLVAAVGLATNL